MIPEFSVFTKEVTGKRGGLSKVSSKNKEMSRA